MKFKEYLDEERGKGMGIGGPRQGDGGTDTCVCPKCGKEIPHTKGIPCKESKCPNTLIFTLFLYKSWSAAPKRVAINIPVESALAPESSILQFIRNFEFPPVLGVIHDAFVHAVLVPVTIVFSSKLFLT